MTLHAYQQSVFSGSDTVAVAPFARITVTNASDDSAASIWSDAAGANPIADGVLLADENGYFISYADEGTYNIFYRDWETDRKSTRLNSSHRSLSRMPSSA